MPRAESGVTPTRIAWSRHSERSIANRLARPYNGRLAPAILATQSTQHGAGA